MQRLPLFTFNVTLYRLTAAALSVQIGDFSTENFFPELH